MSKIYKTAYRVYYEDTDAGGVVYYANYLKFSERARTDMLREMGLLQSELINEKDILFVVRKVEMDLFKPAKLDNLLEIETEIIEIGAAVIFIKQNIFFEKIKLSTINVKLAVINGKLRPVRLPLDIKNLFSK